MTKKAKVTSYEKKYQDKKTGAWKSITINHSKVNDRLLEFKEGNPKSKVLTSHTFEENGTTTFKVYLWKDKKECIYNSEGNVSLDSADSNATANEKTVGINKGFEKLETIALGRALAFLGYTGTGEIASNEEMEEFYDYKQQKIQDAIDNIKACKTLDQLKEVFLGLGNLLAEQEVIAAKDKRKSELFEEIK